MIAYAKTKQALFLPPNRRATLHTQQLIPPATAIQQGAHEINLFPTDHEILSQNTEASRSQLVTSTTNAHLVARVAIEILVGQNEDQSQLWTNTTAQVQQENHTIRSHLAADLILRPAAPILETGLHASARNMDKLYTTFRANSSLHCD
ncbi:MAG: hypothetical protein EZS28_023498 [Streblomastix strix]|uniref:Uncharacterized protein n=1 Tax=Streblomastix strix TaxID=222440 RepID=A0A5J4VEY8_9EUKA|nr:MAG: hypothetical protein EZS28_023498 [Streblomastix strix]